MPGWKALFIVAFGIVCLALVFSTIMIPLILSVEENRWPWFGGFLAGSIIMSVLYILYLRSADREFMGQGRKKGR